MKLNDTRTNNSAENLKATIKATRVYITTQQSQKLIDSLPCSTGTVTHSIGGQTKYSVHILSELRYFSVV